MNSTNNFLFIVLGFLLVASKGVTMSEVGHFFPQIKGNLAKITWAHAVNDKTYLEKVLKDNTIMMIEADVSLGQLNNEGDLTPIMAHPPAKSSDLSLEQFLKFVEEFNNNQQSNETRKGIKLDFKDTDVFQKSNNLVGPLYEQMKCPVWLNADIIRGPLNAATTPVDKDVFLSNAKIYSNVLSLGWTTNYGGDIVNASYTDQQIQNMLNAITSTETTKETLTFAVRAGIAAKSRSQMQKLRDTLPDCTLTIWSSDGDAVDVPKLQEIISDFGLQRVYVDVPKTLRDQLDLGDGGGAGNVQPSVVVMLGALIFAMVLIKSLY